MYFSHTTYILTVKKFFLPLSSVSIVFLSFTFIMQRAKMSLCCAVRNITFIAGLSQKHRQIYFQKQKGRHIWHHQKQDLSDWG